MVVSITSYLVHFLAQECFYKRRSNLKIQFVKLLEATIDIKLSLKI